MKKNIQAVLYGLVIILLLLPSIASALSENIIIMEPIYDSQNDAITSDFSITVQVNDTGIKQVQAKIVSNGNWQTLDQADNLNWQSNINVSNVSNGNYQLSARYQKIGESVYYYVLSTTKIVIQKPIAPVVYGSMQLTITDFLGRPIQDATITPNGDKSNSNGIVSVGNQSINSPILFAISKSGYVDGNLTVTFTDATVISKSVSLNKVGGNLRKFNVIQNPDTDAATAPALFRISILDDYSGEVVNSTDVSIYDADTGNIVKDVTNYADITASTSTSTRSKVSVGFDNPGHFYIGVSKTGYADWESGTITIFGAKATPTPVPTPQPIPPQPNKTFRLGCGVNGDTRTIFINANGGDMITDDEYRVCLSLQETKQIEANNTNKTVPTQLYQPPQQVEFPWFFLGLIGLVVVVGGAIVWKYKKSQNKTNINVDRDDYEEIHQSEKETPRETLSEPKKETQSDYQVNELIKCDLCEFTMLIPSGASESIKKAVLSTHKKEEHGVEKVKKEDKNED